MGLQEQNKPIETRGSEEFIEFTSAEYLRVKRALTYHFFPYHLLPIANISENQGNIVLFPLKEQIINDLFERNPFHIERIVKEGDDFAREIIDIIDYDLNPQKFKQAADKGYFDQISHHVKSAGGSGALVQQYISLTTIEAIKHYLLYDRGLTTYILPVLSLSDYPKTDEQLQEKNRQRLSSSRQLPPLSLTEFRQESFFEDTRNVVFTPAEYAYALYGQEALHNTALIQRCRDKLLQIVEDDMNDPNMVKNANRPGKNLRNFAYIPLNNKGKEYEFFLHFWPTRRSNSEISELNDKNLENLGYKKWYVYSLANENGQVFYIGKGTRGRVFEHREDSAKTHENVRKRIRAIHQRQGGRIIRRIVYNYMTDEEARTAEIALINLSSFAKDLLNITGRFPEIPDKPNLKEKDLITDMEIQQRRRSKK